MFGRTEVRFASFLSGGFTTMAIINPPERKLAKHISMHCTEPLQYKFINFQKVSFFPTSPKKDYTAAHSFLSSSFTTMALINPPERKMAKRTSVQYISLNAQPQIQILKVIFYY